MMKEGPYFEDLPVGTSVETGTYTMTAEAIAAFAREFDPQPFHLDPEAAKGSVFRRLVASGWHTASVAMKLLVESGFYGATGLVGMGVDEMRWAQAVLPGDVLRVHAEVAECAPGASGKRATIRWATTMRNQRDEIVLTMTSITLFPGRRHSTEKKVSP
jgi:acyl dehydratase